MILLSLCFEPEESQECKMLPSSQATGQREFPFPFKGMSPMTSGMAIQRPFLPKADQLSLLPRASPPLTMSQAIADTGGCMEMLPFTKQ